MVVTFDLSEETRAREAARMREKALHDEASALNAAKEEGVSETAARMRACGMTDEQIRVILSTPIDKSEGREKS